MLILPCGGSLPSSVYRWGWLHHYALAWAPRVSGLCDKAHKADTRRVGGI